VRRVEEFSLIVNGFKCLLDGLLDAELFYEDAQTVTDKVNALAGGLMQMMASVQQQQQQQQQQEQAEPQPQQPPEPAATCNSDDAAIGGDVTNQPAADKAENLPYMITCAGSGTSFILVRAERNTFLCVA
jgi:hypothetical protein